MGPPDGGDDTARAARQLLSNRSFLLFVASRVFNILGVHALTVAVGWHVYQMTGDPFDLGLVGISQFAPAFALFLMAGYAADLFDRRMVLVACNAVHVLVAVLLFSFGVSGVTAVWPIFAVLGLHGAARAFFLPASQAILPNIVPPRLFPNAVAYASSAQKIGQLVGPALGGLLVALVSDWAYLAMVGLFAVAALASGLIEVPLAIRASDSAQLSSIFEGLGYIWRKKVVLGAISIDLMAVLFGGVLGILPVFASDVLHVGPDGLGLMRATPALGALGVGLVLAQLHSPGRMGLVLFASLAVFGLSIMVFSLSTWFWLSLAALAVYGGADMVSVYVRQTLVQIATPDEMRGRVTAVSTVSVNASNELGDFRAGSMAAAIGTVPAVLLGGVVTLGVAALWWRLFPDLKRVDRLDA
jgi:MFS family permease